MHICVNKETLCRNRIPIAIKRILREAGVMVRPLRRLRDLPRWPLQGRGRYTWQDSQNDASDSWWL